MIRIFKLALITLVLQAATPTTTVAELIAMVREGISSSEPDASLAKTLHKLRLAEQLDWRVIEEMESEGAGPKSLDEMSQLRDAALALKPPAVLPAFAEPGQPQMEELKQVLTQARNTAIDYTNSLPDFICNQVVRRYASLIGNWHLNDTLEVKLSYFAQREDYKLLTVNGRNTLTNYNSIGGALSQGEFGSLLRMIFDPKSKAQFFWAHWTLLRKRPAYVFSFHIKPEDSSFRLDYQRARGQGRFSTVPGQRGFVWVDRETRRVVRVYSEAEGIQKGFPVIGSSSLLDYDVISIGTTEYLLPLRADVRITSREQSTRNQVEFRDYRKFAAETTISFEPK